MTCYLTDASDPDEIARGFAEGVWVAAKLYPANATTNSAAGVTDVANIRPALERMQAIGMPLLVHGEVTDPDVDVFDREAVFIDRVLTGLVRDFPALKIVLEHITTAEAADFVADAPATVAATITPQHLILNRNALFAGGLAAPRLLPAGGQARASSAGDPPRRDLGLAQIFPRHRQRAARRRGEGERRAAAPGIFNAPFALESYATVFEEEDALDRFEGFASEHGPRFYGLPLNEGTVTLDAIRVASASGDRGWRDRLVPFQAGENLPWRLA